MTLRGKKYAVPKDESLVAELQRTDTRPYELVVLSGIFDEENAKIISSAATVTHFIVPEHVAVHRAFGALYRAGQKVTPDSLVMELESNGSLAREEAKNVVDTLLSATPPRSIKHSIRALGKVQKRQAFYEMVEYLRTPDALRDDLSGAMAHIHSFMAVANVTSGRKIATLTEILKSALERTEPEKTWAPSLLGDLWKYWKIRKGSYTAIAADSGHGKTAAMVCIALGIIRQQDTHVGVISIEMTGKELGYRAAAIEAGVDASRFEDGILTEAEERMIQAELIKNAHIYDRLHVLDPAACAAEDLPGMYNELVKEHECEVILIDYVQRITTRDKASKYDAVSKASATITELTKSLDVATIALSLLARDRDNSKKGLHHLKESGQIGADAATVIIMTMLDDDDDYMSPEKQIEFRCVKARKGQKFKHMLTLHGPTQRFSEPMAGTQFPAQ
jgi:replicative DNA helicase